MTTKTFTMRHKSSTCDGIAFTHAAGFNIDFFIIQFGASLER